MAMIFAFVGCTDVNQQLIDSYKGYVNISAIKCEVSKQYDGFDAYFLEAWVPGNAWGDAGTNKATVKDGVATYNFDAPVKIENGSVNVQLRIIADKSNFWDAPFNKVDGVASVTADSPMDGGTYTLLIKDGEMTFVK